MKALEEKPDVVQVCWFFVTFSILQYDVQCCTMSLNSFYILVIHKQIYFRTVGADINLKIKAILHYTDVRETCGWSSVVHNMFTHNPNLKKKTSDV